ncbi:unnamed protein product [Prorocentrum cordatum]|uniref:Phospholipase B-like n=1 Tax=Prorocentrum cordatum TaxID=2364126 RepID=A0ABN9VEH4_9DINO|nr:unnamed protein product [Polarella glacialis]
MCSSMQPRSESLLEASWGHLGALLGQFWKPVGVSWSPLGALLQEEVGRTNSLNYLRPEGSRDSLMSTSGADIRMTTLPQKLKQADPPFQTHLFGKWHSGARSVANLPINRGYDSHLGFLKGMEDHYTQKSDFDGYSPKYVDLWRDHGPADSSLNGTFSVFRDTQHAIAALDR